jgi:hypothetical protein
MVASCRRFYKDQFGAASSTQCCGLGVIFRDHQRRVMISAMRHKFNPSGRVPSLQIYALFLARDMGGAEGSLLRLIAS